MDEDQNDLIGAEDDELASLFNSLSQELTDDIEPTTQAQAPEPAETSMDEPVLVEPAETPTPDFDELDDLLSEDGLASLLGELGELGSEESPTEPEEPEEPEEPTVEQPIAIQEEAPVDETTDEELDTDLEALLSELDGVESAAEEPVASEPITQAPRVERTYDDEEAVSDALLDDILGTLGATSSEESSAPSIMASDSDAPIPALEQQISPVADATPADDEPQDVLQMAQAQLEKEQASATTAGPRINHHAGLPRPLKDGEYVVIKKRKKAKTNKLANKKVAVGLVAAILLVVGLGAGTVAWLSQEQPVTLDPQQAPIMVFQESIGLAFDSNFIFLSERRGTGSVDFTLSRMLLDSRYTVFYFDHMIDWDNYTLSLVDDNGHVYHLALLGNINTARNRVAFDPVRTDARGLILTITSNATGDSATFPLEFDGVMARLPMAHKNTRTAIPIGDSRMTITGGNFASSGTHLFYMIEFGETGFEFDRVSLATGSRLVPLRSHDGFAVGADTVLGHLAFEPVAHLSGNLNLVFENALMRYDIRQSIDVSPLFANNVLNQIPISFAGGQLTLERMRRRQDQNDFILVFHGTDATGARQQTRINATLRIVDHTGNEVVLEGNVFSTPMGSDMTFEFGEDLGSVVTATLQITSVLFGGEDFTVSLDMDMLETALNFADALVLGEAEQHVRALGYEMVELVTYSIDETDMVAVYIAYAHGATRLYQISATRQYPLGWGFQISAIG